ncbi:putative rna methylase family protein [Erysiphe necator]|uniref:Trimethylguanosine synthase n=1 Tax=Uncinula necator TaxID=52586 RepID=A0A0B1NYP8_UNCNE|nr:putative rna methylase family protein [Erysiphe necator]
MEIQITCHAKEQEINDTSSDSLIDMINTNLTESKDISSKFQLTENCHHYTSLGEVEWDIQKYWYQRYSLFSLYDEGIYLTDDSWFGVTPEPIAKQVAKDLAKFCNSEKKVLIDMFSGAGGNVIAFARMNQEDGQHSWDQIIAIEKDISVLACAYHNATIYNVQKKISWIRGDSFEYLKSHASTINPKQTIIFASPPWGGPSYRNQSVFDLNTMQPYSLNHIYESCKDMDMALYLPRTSDLRQIALLAPKGKKIEVVQYCMMGVSKALVAYIPGVRDDENL